MTRKLLWILVGMLLAGIFLFQASPGLTVEEESATKQVDQLLKNQEKILRDLEEIKKELTVIRIRVN